MTSERAGNGPMEGSSPNRMSPLHPDQILSPHGQAVAITQLVYDMAVAQVGVAAAHRLAANVFEVLDVQ